MDCCFAPICVLILRNQPMKTWKMIWLGFAVMLAGAMVPNVEAQSSFVNFEGKQTSPVRLSPDGSRLFAVNTPDARLSVFDVTVPQRPLLIAEIPVGIEPVSVNPLNDDEVWVVNEVSDSISIVSVSRHAVIETLFVKDEPADVVFANGRAFVSASRNNRIAVFDAVSRSAITNISVFGENPRGLAVSPDQTKVYAAFALSGNRTTLLPPDQAPAPPAPTNPNLPPAPQVSLIVDASDARISFTMPDNDVVEINAATFAIARYFPRVGTVNLGLAVHPPSGDLFVANTEARNLVRFEPNLRGNFVTNRVSRVSVANGATTHFDLNPGFSHDDFPRLPELTNALAQPTAIVFGPSGNNFYVAAFGTDRIARMNTSGAVLNRIELNPLAAGSAARPRTKRGPRGLALKPGQALYVLNRISNTLTVIDPQSNTVVLEVAVGSHDPTPQVIRQGRGFLYDAKLSGNGTVSCASCHIDAEMDMIAWDLGDPNGSLQNNRITIAPGFPSIGGVFHPMKGPMTTQTLRGLNGVDPLHWRGDRTNFLFFNGAFDSLLGGSLLSAADMQAYRDFVQTIVFQPNPNQNLDRSFPTSFPTKNGIGDAAAGRNIFLNEIYQPAPLNLRCNTCHTVPTGTGRSIVAAQALDESQDFKIPHLRNVYQKLNVTRTAGAASVGGFGIVHDGQDPDLFTFLSRDVFGLFQNNTTFKRNLDAFVQCFDTGTAPAVGYARTLQLANVDSGTVSNDWSLLEGQAVAGNIELIVKGTVDRQQHGLLYQPSSDNYRLDAQGLTTLTRSQLRDKVLAGDTLTLMGVPPGSGVRMGLDRNLDGVLDGDTPAPTLHIARGSDSVVLSWSTNAAGFLLEKVSMMPGTVWTPETSARGIQSGEFIVTNAPTGDKTFFRLREL